MSTTRWLDDDEQRTWRSFLTANRLFFDRIERQLQQGAGLNHGYYEILVQLSEAPGRTLRMSRLAETALSSRSRLSHAVARMEEAGWIRRRQDEHDKRGQLAELTDAGFAYLHDAAHGHVEEVRSRLFDALSPEQLLALRDISDTLSAHLADGPVCPTTEAACPVADPPCNDGAVSLDP